MKAAERGTELAYCWHVVGKEFYRHGSPPSTCPLLQFPRDRAVWSQGLCSQSSKWKGVGLCGKMVTLRVGLLVGSRRSPDDWRCYPSPGLSQESANKVVRESQCLLLGSRACGSCRGPPYAQANETVVWLPERSSGVPEGKAPWSGALFLPGALGHRDYF